MSTIRLMETPLALTSTEPSEMIVELLCNTPLVAVARARNVLVYIGENTEFSATPEGMVAYDQYMGHIRSEHTFTENVIDNEEPCGCVTLHCLTCSASTYHAQCWMHK